ncbi:hypothetical protein HK104_006021 [Borealophlyctis nickersoniae]|nr:hypothetical protein HK104_006021 [Borealophlyctis nickersoniae]
MPRPSREKGKGSPSTGSPPTAKERKMLYSSDFAAIEKHLSVLTDEECGGDQYLEALNSLIVIAEEHDGAVDALFDRGAVTILLGLLEHKNDVDVQINACALLQVLASGSEVAMATVFKQNGIPLILNTIQTISKARLGSMQMLRIPKKKSFHTSSDALLPATLEHRDATMHNNTSHLHQGPSQPPAIGASMDPTEESLVTGLLPAYFTPQFLDQFDAMDKSSRMDVVRHLLLLFEKIDKLLAVSSCISLDVNLENALKQIVLEAELMMQAETVHLYIMNPNTGELILKEFDIEGNTQHGVDGGSGGGGRGDASGEPDSEVCFPAGTGIAGYCAQHEVMANVRDAMNHEHFDPNMDARGTNGVAFSILCAPIKTRDNHMKGVLQVVNKAGFDGTPMYFNEEDEFLLRKLAKTAGIIINNMQMYETMRNTQKKVEVLLETTRSLGSTLELDQLIRMIMDAAKGLLNADRCTLFLTDAEKKQLRAHIQGRESIQEIRLAINAGIAGHVFTTGSSVNIPDAYRDPRFNPEVDRQTGYVTRNILCMPIKNIHGEAIGVTQMINKANGPFFPEDERLLSSFSAQAAVAIEKSQLFKKTENMRAYLQSILSSITSCVITLDNSMMTNTINRDWFINALGVTREFVTQNTVDKWIGEKNSHLLNDILKVYQQGTPLYSTEYELKGKTSMYINYQIMPLIGENKGVVMVLDDISSEKRAVMTLGRYMSPALAKQVMEEDGNQLGGKRKKVAILFSDIRSFTTLAESMEPHEVVDLLNAHFSDAVNAIMAEQGILDKYIGDAVMAVFGVPFVSEEDSTHACSTALRMQASLAVLNEKRASAGKKTVKIGIGVNTGMVLSGNIGSTKRMEFSCIGDAVNLASRTEGLTKAYGLTILITENTLIETGDNFITREIDSVIVTGKSNKVNIYELMGKKGDELPPKVLEACRLYAEGLKQYRKRNFSGAVDLFGKAVEVAKDGPSKTMLARCKKYLEEPPPENWNGVYVAEGK